MGSTNTTSKHRCMCNPNRRRRNYFNIFNVSFSLKSSRLHICSFQRYIPQNLANTLFTSSCLYKYLSRAGEGFCSEKVSGGKSYNHGARKIRGLGREDALGRRRSLLQAARWRRACTDTYMVYHTPSFPSTTIHTCHIRSTTYTNLFVIKGNYIASSPVPRFSNTRIIISWSSSTEIPRHVATTYHPSSTTHISRP
jgi:hypothetical protein